LIKERWHTFFRQVKQSPTRAGSCPSLDLRLQRYLSVEQMRRFRPALELYGYAATERRRTERISLGRRASVRLSRRRSGGLGQPPSTRSVATGVLLGDHDRAGPSCRRQCTGRVCGPCRRGTAAPWSPCRLTRADHNRPLWTVTVSNVEAPSAHADTGSAHGVQKNRSAVASSG